MTALPPQKSPTAGREIAVRPALLRLMALATALAVAGNYLAYPILDLLQQRLLMSPTTAGLLVTAAQAGYAVGLIVLVPLADVARRRPLALALLMATAAGLVAAGSAPTGSVLLIASTLAAFTSVGAQVIVPYAAELAGPAHQARALGVVMSGLVLGTVVSRFASGLLADAVGWRTPYFVLAALLLAASAALSRALPRYDRNSGKVSLRQYCTLMRSLGAVIGELPALRLRSAVAALALASFMVQGAAVTFLLAGPEFGWSPTAIGALGLLGAIGALTGPWIGRLIDRGYGPALTIGGLAVESAAWLVMIPASGAIGLVALVIGLVFLGLGQQAAMNTSQAVAYALKPAARGRINAVFMGSFFLGGTLGSAATAALWPVTGWTGICLLGSGLAGGALLIYLAFRRIEIDCAPAN